VTARVVLPSTVRGRVSAPPSKSYTHRALVAGFLSRRRFSVVSPLASDDTQATARALGHLGVRVDRAAHEWTVVPVPRPSSPRSTTIDCRESGTTLRFASALAALESYPVRFRGRGRLGHRPMHPLFAALKVLGASISPASGRALFSVQGPIHGGRVRLDASESSQFASALLLALPTVASDSRLRLTGPIVSEPYMRSTAAVLRHLKVSAIRRGREFRIRGGQQYVGTRMVVPGDASSAAYLWVAGAVAGGSVTVRGVSHAWPQADLAILDLLRRSGAEVREGPGATTVAPGVPRPFSVDLTDSPDLYPLAGVLAATIPGTSRLRGAAQVVHKESNRRLETARLARAFGAKVRASGGALTIEGRGRLRAVNLRNLSDHRIVMSAAVGALAASGPSRIGEAEAVRKSFPDFWRVLDELRSGGMVA
jgi:3-phosphoshikimate 1-carboxyvinyltransferase